MRKNFLIGFMGVAFFLSSSLTFAGETVVDMDVLAGIEAEVRELLWHPDFAEQDAALAALDRKYEGDLLARVWLRRCFGMFVIHAEGWWESVEKRERKAAYEAAYNKWMDGQIFTGRTLHCARMTRLSLVHDKVYWSPESILWLDEVREMDDWEPFAEDYALAVRRYSWEETRARNRAGLADCLSHWRRIVEVVPGDKGCRGHLHQMVVALWEHQPLALPAGELAAETESFIDILFAMDIGEFPRFQRMIILDAVSVAAAGEEDFCESVISSVEGHFPDDPWLDLARSRTAYAQGDADGASRLRAVAAAKSLTADFPAGERWFDDVWRIRSRALREQAAADLSMARWDDALGMSRAFFNMSRTEDDVIWALESAGRAAMGKAGGGLTAARAYLGLAVVGAEQPEDWRAARVGAVWRDVMMDAYEDEKDLADPAAWRRRSLLAMMMADGELAARAAAVAYSLPDFSQESQLAAIETAAAAMRALSGLLPESEKFAAYQVSGAANDKYELPEIPAILDKAELDDSWDELMSSVDGRAMDGDWLELFRKYASSLVLAGYPDEAFGVMRSLYALRSDASGWESIVNCLAGLMRARDGHLVNANVWLEYQRYGQAGRDGLLDTADDLTDPLAGVEWKYPPEWSEFWRLQAVKRRQARDEEGAVYLSLIAGDVAEALAGARRLRNQLPFDEEAWKGHVQFAAAVLRAISGDPFAGGDYVDFMRYGTDGPEGAPGSLTDPLDMAE